jgi:uncharacterized membrane protein
MASRKQGARSQGQAARGGNPGTASRGGRPGASSGGRTTAAAAKSATASGRQPAQGRSASSGRGAATATRQSPAKAVANGSASSRNGAAGATAARAVRAGGLLRPLRPFPAVTPFQLTVFLLTLVGLGVSIYLTITHYDTSVTLVCSDKGLVNCEEVTTSSQSMVFGIFPVAVLGLAFYTFLTFVNSPWVWRWQQSPPRWVQGLAGFTRFSSADAMIRWTRLGSLVVGMGFVLYLIYAELIQIGAICLWCTSVHVVTFLLFCLIVFNATFSWNRMDAAR